MANFTGDSAIINAGSNDVSGQMWVAVGQNESEAAILYSFDKITWASPSINPIAGGTVNKIATNGSYWVAVGFNTGNTVCIATSPDGITWAPSTNNPFSPGVGFGIAWNGSYWVSGGAKDNIGSIATSTDGMTWTDASNSPFSDGYQGFVKEIAWSASGSYWVAVGCNRSIDPTISIARSSDGMTWVDSVSGGGNNPFSGGYGLGIAYSSSQNKWVAVGYNSDSTVCIASSTDGMIWTDASNNPFTIGYGVSYSSSQNKWVAVGNNSDQSVCIASSPDGMTWTPSLNNPFTGGAGNGICWDGSYWLAVGYASGNCIAISTDGLIWTPLSVTSISVGNGIASGPAPFHNSVTTIKTLTAPLYFYVAAGKGEGLMYSSDGTVWTKSPSMPTVADYNDVIYAGGLWVAVGGNIVTSTDGITWTTVEVDWLNGAPFAVAYGGGKWVISGTFTSKLRYSTDTITWTECTNASTIFDGTAGISAVAYGNNMWVACGVLSSGNVGLAYSTDGIAWTASPTNSIFGTQSYSIAYGNGLWVIGCNGNSAMVYSTDGMSWTVSSDGTTIMAACVTVFYGNGLWVAGGDGTNTLAYSTDGMTWTGSPSSAIFDACDVVTYNGKWMAAGTDNQLAYSSDGISWTASVIIDIGTGVQGLAIRNLGTAFVAQTAFDNDTYDASGDIIPNRTILNDTNAIPVTTTVTLVEQPGWVAVGIVPDGSVSIATSTDGVSWTPSTNNPFSGASGSARAVYWNGSYWLAVGQNADRSNCIAISQNGITWTDSVSAGGNNPFLGGSCNGIAWSGSYWVAVGVDSSGNTIATSSDGINWTDASDNPFSGGVGMGIAYNASYWLAVGNNYPSRTVCIASSSDGMTWTDSSNNPFSGGGGSGIAWSDYQSKWVAVGFNLLESYGTVCIATSPDGITWTDSSNNPFSGGYGNGIAYSSYQNKWVAVGYNLDNTVCIANSTDGMTWTDASNNPFSGGGQGRGIAYSPSENQWVAVGFNPDSIVCIATSPNGMTWTASSNNPFSEGFGIAPGILTTEITTIQSSTVIIESIYDGTGKSLYLGGLTGATDTSTHIQDSANNFIGRDLSGYMRGSIKEILVYNTAHDEAQRQQVETYLKNKWYANTYVPTTMSLWLDADPAKMILVGAQSNRVQTWKDKSPYGVDVSQNIIWAQPQYGLDPITQRYGVQFGSEGLTTGFSTTQPFVGATNSYSVFAVQRYAFSTDQDSDSYGGAGGLVCTTYATVPQQVPGFVAVGYDPQDIVSIATSVDGITWTAAANPFPGGAGTGIAWSGSYWVAVGYDVERIVCIASSTDGIIWTPSSNNPFSGGGGFGSGIAWSASQWIAVGTNSAQTVSIARSTDGMTWTPSSNNPFSGGQGNGIAYSPSQNQWVAVGRNSSNTVCIASSLDGISWTAASGDNPFIGGMGFGIAFSGSQWVAVGFNNSLEYGTVCIATSPDGMTWTEASNNPFSGGAGNGIAWSSEGSKWVAVGQNSDNTVCIATSPDGMSWTDASNNPFDGGFGYGITYSSTDQWVAVGRNSAYTVSIATSTDGMTWTDASNNPFPDGGYGNGIAAGNLPAPSQKLSLGTLPANFPGVREVAFNSVGNLIPGGTNNYKPMMTGHVVNSQIYNTFCNGTPVDINQSTGGPIASVPLRIGFSGDLTPAFQGAMRGYIYEMLVYNRNMGTEERQAIEGYLAWKWGIQGDLPGDHPYYMAPPPSEI